MSTLVEDQNIDTKKRKREPIEEEDGETNPQDFPKRARTTELQTERVVPLWMEQYKLIGDESVELDSVANVFPIHSQLIRNLQSIGLSHLFPVQVDIIPEILKSSVTGGDICVCAPTGSGKTLAYVIPILQLLQTQIVKRLRALVVVPTRELVKQVTDVFRKMIKGTQIHVMDFSTSRPFTTEQAMLRGDKSMFPSPPGTCGLGEISCVDIIVTTPGRLVEHLDGTPGFTLQHLMFLVIDEVDRLLGGLYQDWLPKVLNAIYTAPQGKIVEGKFSYQFSPSTSRTPPETAALDSDSGKQVLQFPQVQKLLFSATITQNPQKLATLKLVNPKFFSSTTQYLYKMPETLKQKFIVCDLDKKPLYLLQILQQVEVQQVLCFTSSVETTHRLFLLLQILMEDSPEPLSMVEYSSALAQDRYPKMRDFKSGKIRLMICSDVMSRGLDVVDVGLVINYDVPHHLSTYIHRVGRTARAGKEGTTITLMQRKEMHHFFKMVAKAEGSKQEKMSINWKTHIYPKLKKYQVALTLLEELIAAEKGSEASHKKKMKNENTPVYSENKSDVELLLWSLQTQAQKRFFPELVNEEKEEEEKNDEEGENEEKQVENDEEGENEESKEDEESKE